MNFIKKNDYFGIPTIFDYIIPVLLLQYRVNSTFWSFSMPALHNTYRQCALNFTSRLYIWKHPPVGGAYGLQAVHHYYDASCIVGFPRASAVQSLRGASEKTRTLLSAEISDSRKISDRFVMSIARNGITREQVIKGLKLNTPKRHCPCPERNKGLVD